jgi:hypothetical protein
VGDQPVSGAEYAAMCFACGENRIRRYDHSIPPGLGRVQTLERRLNLCWHPLYIRGADAYLIEKFV